MPDAMQVSLLTQIGIIALILFWLILLAPLIAEKTSTKLRLDLARDIEITRSSSCEELMPQTPRLRLLFLPLTLIWVIAFTALWITKGLTASFLLFSVFFAALFLLSLIDLNTQILPSGLVGFVLWSGVLSSTFGLAEISVEESIWGIVYAWLMFSLPTWIMALTNKNSPSALGGGDIALLCACGAWLGSFSIILAACLAVLFGIVTKMFLRHADQQYTYLPFGPFISIAAISAFFLNFHY